MQDPYHYRQKQNLFRLGQKYGCGRPKIHRNIFSALSHHKIQQAIIKKELVNQFCLHLV